MSQSYQTTNPLQGKIHLCKMSIVQVRRRRKKNRAKIKIIQAQHRKTLTQNQDTIIASLETQKKIPNIIEVKARRRC